MYSLTGNFILSKTFLNRKKTQKKEERAGGETRFLDGVPGAPGPGPWPGSHSPLSVPSVTSRQPGDGGNANQNGAGLVGCSSEAELRVGDEVRRLCSGVSASDGCSVAGEASSPSQLCARRSLLQVANFTSL